MIGDVIVSDGVELETVWAGGEGLVACRPTKVSDVWVGPNRLYTRTGNHIGKAKSRARVKPLSVDIPGPILEDRGLDDA